MPRKLRIAVSVFFGLLAVVLCALWVRSYFVADTVEISVEQGKSFRIESFGGQLEIVPMYTVMAPGIQFDSMRFVDTAASWIPGISWPMHAFSPTVPHWCFAVASAGIAGLAARVSNIGHRFSLRTMLIATTLVAVVLGLAVWAAS